MSGQPLSLRTEALSETLPRLTAGELLTLTGAVYAGGQETFFRLAELAETGCPLPIDLSRAVLCCGSPAAGGNGGRFWDLEDAPWMDEALDILLKHGLRAVVGRGERSDRVRGGLIQNRGVYFAALGTVAALNGTAVRSVSVAAFQDAKDGGLKRLGVLDLPLVAAIDTAGGDIYRKGRTRYADRVPSQIW